MSMLDTLKYVAGNLGPIDISEKEIGPGANIQANGNTITQALNGVFVFVGALCVLFLIVGAIRYTLSGGNASEVQKAKDTMLYAIIGVLVVVFSFAIVAFVSGGVALGL